MLLRVKGGVNQLRCWNKKMKPALSAADWMYACMDGCMHTRAPQWLVIPDWCLLITIILFSIHKPFPYFILSVTIVSEPPGPDLPIHLCR